MKRVRNEYLKMLQEMTAVDKFMRMEHSLHHGVSRFEHTKRVAYISFIAAKILRLDVPTVTRGALLHDFFTEDDVSGYTKSERHKMHPAIALENSNRYFKLNDIEKNIIMSHMYPISRVRPKFKESHVVATADKIAAVYEFIRFKKIKLSRIEVSPFMLNSLSRLKRKSGRQIFSRIRSGL